MHAKNLHNEHIKCANFESQCSFPQISSFLSVFLSFCLSFCLFVCLFSSFSFALFIFLFKYYSVSHFLINQLCCGVVWCGVVCFALIYSSSILVSVLSVLLSPWSVVAVVFAAATAAAAAAAEELSTSACREVKNAPTPSPRICKKRSERESVLERGNKERKK